MVKKIRKPWKSQEYHATYYTYFVLLKEATSTYNLARQGLDNISLRRKEILNAIQQFYDHVAVYFDDWLEANADEFKTKYGVKPEAKWYLDCCKPLKQNEYYDDDTVYLMAKFLNLWMTGEGFANLSNEEEQYDTHEEQFDAEMG